MIIVKIECVKDKLTEAVLRAEKVSSKSSTLPVLKCLLFDADKGYLIIKATNLDVGVECKVPVKVERPGRVAVLGGVLANFLNNLGGEKQITIETEEGGITVSSYTTKTSIKTLNVEDFPDLPKVEDPIVFTIDVQDFVIGLKSVWYSSATTSIKPELSSVRIFQDGDFLVFVATDGFRLAEKRIKIKNLPEFNHILIPVKNVGELIRLLDGVNGDLSVSIDQGQIEVVIDSMRIVSRTIDGVFPDYQAIIPKEFATEAKIIKQDLVGTLRLTNLFSDSYNQMGFTVHVEGKNTEITSKNKELGEHTSKVNSVTKGEDIRVQFNYRYLSDCLSSIKGDTIEFCFAGKQRPIIIRSVGDSSFLYLMMPMNV